jgi:hypothetical protein
MIGINLINWGKWLVDKGGMVFSVDLMMAIIIITVVLGVSADAMDMIGFKMDDSSHEASLERIARASADMLTKTPGSPEDWDGAGDLSGVTPGLLDTDSPLKSKSNILSMPKINCLKENYDELMVDRVIPRYCKSTLVIYPEDTSLEPITVKEIPENYDSSGIIVENRTVLCNYYNTSILVFINAQDSLWEQKQLGEKCPHSGVGEDKEHLGVDYKNQRSGWACYAFKVTPVLLNSTDLYIMTDPVCVGDSTAFWMIDRPENMTEEHHTFQNKPILVNNLVEEIVANETVAILWFHVHSSGNQNKSFNTYLAGFPKGTDPENIKFQYLNPQPCYFILKIWT